MTVNGRALENYFPTEASRGAVKQALLATETADKFDVLILAHGGGIHGQASAVRLGYLPGAGGVQRGVASRLKKLGYLTRDARKRERKKYGQKGARKRFQFSKR
jgi:small subunit ribosomal protein S9